LLEEKAFLFMQGRLSFYVGRLSLPHCRLAIAAALD